MGMFDYVRFSYPLPAGTPNLAWQTKDTPAQRCDTYEVREDGTLWHEAHDTEDHSDPNAKGLERLMGCMTSVNQRWEKRQFTGEIRFYGSDKRDTWWEFSTYFIEGQLNQLHQILPEPTP